MPKVLITGSNGILGKDLVQVFKSSTYNVTPCDIRDFDITDIDHVLSFVEEDKPDLIVHPAAWTDVDGCEVDRDKAYTINALGTRNMAVACNRLDIPLVYYSTDYVFNGEKEEGYRESDNTDPVNIYGWSKLEGENLVKSMTNKFYIIRISWLYGLHGKNFVDTILRLAQEKKELKVVDDQTGSPTYTMDVAMGTLTLCQKPIYGTYHMTNSGTCTWFEFAKDICELAGLNKTIIPVTSEEYKRAAKRPRYSRLENYNWKMEGYPDRRHYKEALSEFIKERKNRI